MRILAISSFYPPHFVGGFELGCQRVMEELARRGHDVGVLTSTHGVGRPQAQGNVYRQFRLHEPWGLAGVWHAGRVEAHNQRVLRRVLADFRPDVVTVWCVWRLSNSVLPLLSRRRLPTVLAVSDYCLLERNEQNYWLSYWRWKSRGRLRALLKGLARRVVARFVPTEVAAVRWENSFFTSATLRRRHAEAGLPAAAGRVIHWGVDVEAYRTGDRARPGPAGSPRVLFAGQLEAVKGVHTLLEALPRLSRRATAPLAVCVAGAGADASYLARLGAQAGALNGKCAVRFLGKVPSEKMPDVYRAHDVLVLPSVWEEPFSLTLLEAMAAGLCVVGTTRGGSAEILQDGVNCLTFAAGDAQDLARQLQRLVDDPALGRRLAGAGQRLVRERFSLRGTVDQIEALLHDTVDHPR
jgi:glycogen(starch) synthase